MGDLQKMHCFPNTGVVSAFQYQSQKNKHVSVCGPMYRLNADWLKTRLEK